MEINKENKEMFDAFIDDYISSYKGKQPEKELKENAVKFAVNQLIYNCATNKSYEVAHGSMAPGEVKIYDVILAVTMFTGEVDSFYVVLEGDSENAKAFKVVRGDGDMSTDKLVSILLNVD